MIANITNDVWNMEREDGNFAKTLPNGILDLLLLKAKTCLPLFQNHLSLRKMLSSTTNKEDS